MPKFTRRDFKYLASCIADLPSGDCFKPSELAVYFATKLAHTNPRFKYQTFIDACKKPELDVGFKIGSKGRKRNDRKRQLAIAA